MAVGLAAASAAILWGVNRAIDHPGSTSHTDVLAALAAIVVLGTGATLLGAWWLSGSALRPVTEITAQATQIEGGTLDQRIVAHAQTEEYQGLVGVLNRMLERLERAFAAQRRLTADVSHELRTPLTALRGEIEIALRSERAPRDYQRVLHSALEEIDRLSRITEDALLITRADARVTSAQRAPADLNGLLRDTVARWRPRLESAEVRAFMALDEHLPDVPLDRVLMTRLIDHLLDNAIKQTPPQGMVELRTARVDGGLVRFSITDSGPGIDPANLPHVFDAFYRADPARPRGGGGAGLGPAVVAAIARLHGGSARVANVPQGGARFEIDLAAHAA
jgi:signal transduction histidine kinase